MLLDLNLVAALASKEFSRFRICIPNGEIDKTKTSRYVIDWPRSRRRSLKSIYSDFQELGMIINSKLPSVDYYKYSHTEYKNLKSENNLLDYIRFKILRNYFAIKRLEQIPSKQIPDLEI